MMLHKTVTNFCRKHRIGMDTNAGQHFLIDESVLADIVAASGMTASDHVLEVGAGLGILTKELLAHAGRVTTIEQDRRWIDPLNAYLNTPAIPKGKLTILNANALDVPPPQDPYIVVANIPYHITAPLLRQLFLESANRPQSATLLVQKEVAEKLAETPPSTFLGVLVALAGTTRIVRMVPPASFLPPPKVESAVIRIDAHTPALVTPSEARDILRFASAAFAGKRKMLRGTVGKIHGGAERLEAAGINGERRPQTLAIEEWIALARA